MSGQGCASGRSLADTKVTSSYLSPGSIQQNAEDSHGIVTDDGCSWISTSNESASTVGTSIEKRREDMIWRIIQAVTRWLRLQFEQAHIKAGEYTAESCTNSSAQSNDTAQFQQDQVKRAGKRKSDARDSDKYDDSEDDNMLRPPPLGPDDRKDKEQEVIRLACPYFKYNPTKYQQWPICPGPGWSDVHRVKEHLYRKHRQPRFRCVRCWECFDSEQTYIDHQRAQIPCELGEKEPIEGFDAEQERQLKSRKKRSRVVSEIDKWKAVYQILFPHIPPERIPSPFYGDEAHTHETLTECEEYILREIPLRLREILVPEFERDLQIVEQSLQRRTIELTRATLASLFQEFRNMHLQSSVSTMTPSSSEAQDQAGPSSSHAQSPWFEPGENRSFLDFSMFDFDPIPPDGSLSLFDDVQLEDIPQAPTGSGNSAFKQSDSGYDSNNIERFDNEGRY
ncbi:hypothetical protein F4808DRAFT_454683 [Astrocystis sublimbata]|nr:hypothetical protein F4808DRAFT_454683 [Astrocystis sublimbata]